MDPPGLGDVSHLGSDAPQVRYALLRGGKVGEKFWFSLDGTQIPFITENLMKRLGKTCKSCTLKDVASSTNLWVYSKGFSFHHGRKPKAGWQQLTNQANQKNSQLGHASTASFPGCCGHCWYINSCSPVRVWGEGQQPYLKVVGISQKSEQHRLLWQLWKTDSAH